MKIAICVPHVGDVKALFALSLAQLTARTLMVRTNFIAFYFDDGGPLEYKRTNLARRALADNVDWILWLDSDHTFPPDTLLRLLDADRPIIGCNYASRRSRQAIGFTLDGRELRPGRGIETVGALGMGVFLTRADVFKAIPQPWFASKFVGEAFLGEDVHFCNQGKAAGFPVAVDHDLSNEVGHIGEQIRTLWEVAHVDTALPAAGTG